MTVTQKGFIVDLDGTLYRGDSKLPYAAEFIEAVRHSGSRLLFLTNNSTRTNEDVSSHLQRMGIAAAPDEVLTTAQATVSYLQEQQLGKRIYCIGEHGLTSALDAAGFVRETAAGAAPVDAVVQALDRALVYEHLKEATGHILAGAAFIQTNPDLLLPSDREFLPGAGTIGAALHAATGVAPVVIGKPTTIIMKYALEQLGLPAADVWMVGDNLRTDIAAGKAAGCRTALLLTGVSNAEVYQAHEQEMGFSADGVYETLQSFAQDIGLKL